MFVRLVGRYVIAVIAISLAWLWYLVFVARFWLIVLNMSFRR